MKTKGMLIRLFALMLALAMVFSVAGCNDKKTSSDDSADDDIKYGDYIEEITDDDDSVTIQTGNSGTSSGSGAGTGNSNSAGGAVQGSTALDYDFNIENKFQADDNKKATLFEKIPASYKNGKTTVSVAVWWNPMTREVKQAEEFQKKTGIKVKWVQSNGGGDAYVQKIASLRVQGNAPDLGCTATSSSFPAMYMQGMFRPLSEGKFDLTDKTTFDLDSMNMFKWNGKLYGAIIKGSTHMTFGVLNYNADMFDQAGVKTPYEYWQEGTWTWDNFVKCATEIQNKTGKTAVTASYQAYRLAQTCGEDAVKFQNGKIVNNSSSAKYREGYKWVNNLTAAGEHKVLSYTDCLNLFLAGDYAMYVEDNWILQADNEFTDLGFRLGYSPLPTPNGERLIPSDAQLWGFIDGAKNIEAASYFLEYWHNPAYAVKGYPFWLNDSVAAFMSYLWESPKTFQMSHAITNYGGDYDFYEQNYHLTTCGVANVDSRVDAFSNIIESNIKKIYAEFS